MVEGVFEVGDRPELLALLDAHGIEVDDGLVVLQARGGPAGRAPARG